MVAVACQAPAGCGPRTWLLLAVAHQAPAGHGLPGSCWPWPAGLLLVVARWVLGGCGFVNPSPKAGTRYLGGCGRAEPPRPVSHVFESF